VSATIWVGDRPVGEDDPVYIIAEIGANHDGSIAQARDLIVAAATAGADAAKFQFFDAFELYPGKRTEGGIPREWLPKLQEFCQHEGVEFLCSVFSLDTLDAYLLIDPPAIKIASPEATNYPLLEEAAASGVPLLVSTGALFWEQLDVTVRRLLDTELVLLHCVSAYPAPPAHLNLRVIQAMQQRYGTLVGFSDHSLVPLAPALAATLGACVIEKHLTLDRGLPGPDHGFALEPGEFELMVAEVHAANALLGSREKRVQPSEDPHDRRFE